MISELVTGALDIDRVEEFAAAQFQIPRGAELTVSPLRGGLEANGISRARVNWRAESGNRSVSFVVKPVSGFGHRELDIYRALQNTPAAHVMPRLLGFEQVGRNESYMYIDWVRPAQRWPWRNIEYNEAVMDRLAAVHRLDVARLRSAVPSWDYETELMASAEETLQVYADADLAGSVPGSRPMLRTLERLIATLPAMRVALQSAYSQVFLHGDVHAGNAVLRRERERPEIILLDWGRARFGSPLEDLASWLQSLSHWEYEVRRRHDTLFRSYLQARNLPDRLTPELRSLYWVAACSNAMAGALRYHLAVANDPERSNSEQVAAAGAVADWLRIIRRADASWRN